MDIALKYNAGIKQFDLAIEDGDLAAEEGLQTAVILSLFTDRRGDSVLRLSGEANDRSMGPLRWLLPRANEQEKERANYSGDKHSGDSNGTTANPNQELD